MNGGLTDLVRKPTLLKNGMTDEQEKEFNRELALSYKTQQ